MLSLFATPGQFFSNLKASFPATSEQLLRNLCGTRPQSQPDSSGILPKARSKFLTTLEQLFRCPGAAPPATLVPPFGRTESRQ